MLDYPPVSVSLPELIADRNSIGIMNANVKAAAFFVLGHGGIPPLAGGLTTMISYPNPTSSEQLRWWMAVSFRPAGC